MKIAFRVDASERIGSGHLMRCLTLAQFLVTRGDSVLFISRAHPGHLLDHLMQQGFELLCLSAPVGGHESRPDDPYSSWRGLTEDADAAETVQVLRAAGHTELDWLVVDHYGLGVDWERTLAPHTRRLLAIDDLDRSHACELLVDQNFVGPGTMERYRDRVPPDCLRLLGPCHALLQPEYAQRHIASHVRSGTVRSVFVFFGGSDTTDETGKVLAALAEPAFSSIFAEIVVGQNYTAKERIRSLAATRGNAVVRESVPSLAPLMARSDLGFGACGATTWERLCLGLPTLVTCIAENQRQAAAALSDAGVVTWLGDANELSVADYALALRIAQEHPQRLCAQSDMGLRMVDGNGCERVVNAMTQMTTEDVGVSATAG